MLNKGALTEGPHGQKHAEKSTAICFVIHFMLTHFFRGNHTRSDLIIWMIHGDPANSGICPSASVVTMQTLAPSHKF